jgi:YD repeat-containing protein
MFSSSWKLTFRECPGQLRLLCSTADFNNPIGKVVHQQSMGEAVPTPDTQQQDTSGGILKECGAAFQQKTCVRQSNTRSTIYGLSTLSWLNGDSNTYEVATNVDANQHVQDTYTDALNDYKDASPDNKDTPANEKTPRVRYTLAYTGSYGGTLTVNTLTTMQYNVLNKPTSVMVTDLTPQTGQSITSVTTTTTYDDLGRMTSLNDPDRGNHTYTYDANGRQITDVSGTRTIGYQL